MTGADAQQFARAAAGRKDDLTSDCCCRRVARLARVRKRDKHASTPWSGAFINLKKQSQGDFGRSFGAGCSKTEENIHFRTLTTQQVRAKRCIITSDWSRCVLVLQISISILHSSSAEFLYSCV